MSVVEPVVLWATPNAVAIRWGRTGGESFLRYEVLLAKSKDDLADEVGTFRRVNAIDNPELDDAAPEPWAIIRELDADTLYFIRIRAVDLGECGAPSEVFSAKTPVDAFGYISVFEDTVTPPAEPGPAPHATVENGMIVYRPANDPTCMPSAGGDSGCGPPVRITGLALDLAQEAEEPGLKPDSFDDAFVEIIVENLGEFPSNYAEVNLRLAGTDFFEVAGFTLPARTGQQVVQVPLREMRNNSTGEVLSFSHIDTRSDPPPGFPLEQMAIGAQWNKTGEVRVDRMRIRY